MPPDEAGRLTSSPLGIHARPRIFARFLITNVRSLALYFLLLSAVSSLGQSAKKNAGPLVLFTVKGNPVYTDEFIYLFQKNHVKPAEASSQKVEEYLQLLINFK